MKLNRYLLGLALIGSVLFTGNVVKAQTTNIVQNFITTAYSWGTSYNTNLAWTAKIQFDSGVATKTSVSISDRIYGQYNITPSIGIGAYCQFEGVGSPFSGVGGTLQYALINKYDFKLGGENDTGYDINKADVTGKHIGAIEDDIGLFAAKLMTGSSYMTIKYLYPLESKGDNASTGMIYFGLGGTF